MKKISLFIVGLFALQLMMNKTLQAVDPGRVQVSNSTVVNADGELLRGSALWIWRARMVSNPSSKDYAFDPNYYQALADSGVNTIRLTMFDPWQKSEGNEYTDFTDPGQTEFILNFADSIIDYASQYGFNVLINYHDVGRYDTAYLRQFWDAVAPRYKDRTHVAFELWNEPEWLYQWDDVVIDDMADAYEHLHNLAPNTHISLFSFPWLGDFWAPAQKADYWVDRFNTLYSGLVDWSKASVAFHAYGWSNSEPLMNIMNNYPVLETESNFPLNSNIPVANRDPQSQSMDGYLFVNQHHEINNISWLQHKTQGADFYSNWPLIVQDAKRKGYIWFGDRYKMTIESNLNHGKVTPVPIYEGDVAYNHIDSGHYRINTNALLMAVPQMGYEFSQWTGDVGGAETTHDTLSILMDANKSITANFVEKNVVLSWKEGFDGFTTGTQSDAGTTAWSVDDSQTSGAKVEVNDGTADADFHSQEVFLANDTDGEGIWMSESIAIPSSASHLDISVDLASEGGLEVDDYIKVYYTLDGGSEVLVAERYEMFVESGWERVSTLGIDATSASNIQIIIKCKNTGSDEYFYWDNINVIAIDNSTVDNKEILSFESESINPNPLCEGTAFLNLIGYPEGENVDIAVYNTIGSLIEHKEVQIGNGHATKVKLLDRNALVEGLYILQIKGTKGKKELKLIAQ